MRGDYDYNHTLGTTALTVIVFIVVLCALGLGGLVMGLDILGRF